jgi:UDP-hydrolysing UDP-N-acetyl-D-glucosamine 2-epimerase
MKSVIKAISAAPNLEHRIIVGGGAVLPKYGNILQAINGNNLKVDRVIHFLVEGENPVTMAKSAGIALMEFTTAFENLKPDVVLVIADRYECLSIAMAASYMNIPIAHVEGGEVSGSIDESVRHAITKLSHIHFPATKEAAERVKKMGEDPDSIFPVGCTSLDVLNEQDLTKLIPLIKLQEKAGVGKPLDLTTPYLVVIQHPVTTEYEDNLKQINQTVQAVDSLAMNTVWIWPNMDAGSDGISKGIRMFREQHNPSYVHFFKSLPIEYYGPLLKNAACIIGNSSSGIRESSFLGVPSVNIGSRQLGREKGDNVIDVDYDAKQIVEAIYNQLAHGSYPASMLYGDGRAGEKIVNVLKDTKVKVQKRIYY